MTITINGSGTITGISAGGLPDNVIDNGCMADDAIDSAELANGSIDAVHLASGVGGKVLQVVHVSTGTRSAIDSTSFTDCTNMTLDITPSSASNKILAIAECVGISSESAALSAASFRLLQDSAVIGMATNMGAMQDEPLNMSVTFVSLDDATSTNAHTYKVQLKNRQSGEVVLNNTSGGDTSSITLIEVAA
tara:strand:- start:222 stop:797 length:576 start_codon:yes stop_codon:yes gene_type:complete